MSRYISVSIVSLSKLTKHRLAASTLLMVLLFTVAPIASSQPMSHVGGTISSGLSTSQSATPTLTQSTTSIGSGRICNTINLSSTPAPWITGLSIPKFDPALGALSSIEFTIGCCGGANIGGENRSASPSIINTQAAGSVTVQRPDQSVIVCSTPVADFSDSLPSFDGTVDYGGISGFSRTVPFANTYESVISPPPISDLVFFTGTGSITLPIHAQASFVIQSDTPYRSFGVMNVCASASVCYNYDPVACVPIDAHTVS